MAPRMLIGTLFGVRIRDPAWFEHRLRLLSSITVPSLLAQGDRGFEWAIFTGDRLDAEVEAALLRLLEPFEGRAFLVPAGNAAAARLQSLAEERGLAGPGGHVLTARIDDDDAWRRSTVGDVRARAEAWIEKPGRGPALGLTFEDGLEWVMYEMLDSTVQGPDGSSKVEPAAIRPFKIPFTSISAFVCARPETGAGALASQHSQIPKWLEDNGCDVEAVSTGEPMWVYCRHKQAGGTIRKSPSGALSLTLGELAADFGIDEARTRSYLATAGEHSYCAKYLAARLMALERELRDLGRQIDATVDPDPLAALEGRRARLAEELSRVAGDVMSPPESVFSHGSPTSGPRP